MKRVLMAGALALGLSTAARAADDTEIDAVCGPLATPEIITAMGLKKVSHDEWVALRIVFFMQPNTPADFPPGDSALILEHTDGTATVLFVDGGSACSPLRIDKLGVDMLKKLRDGRITHPKGGL